MSSSQVRLVVQIKSTWNDGPHGVSVGAWDVDAVHLVGQNDVAEGIDGLVEGKRAAVMVAHFVVIVPAETHVQLTRHFV